MLKLSYSFIGYFVVFFFLQPKPRIDYTLKAVGGSLTALPGVSDMIDVSFDILILRRIFSTLHGLTVILWM